MNQSDPTSISEEDLRRAIEDFYLPRHLVRAIFDIGQIPAHSTESKVGIGFIDIADYTYISKFLSAKENQILLNGLYTAFQMVLDRHGGYLNKIEGDSMMFHFDGIINTQFKNLETRAQLEELARQLFYTCVEMQRVCTLFNQANTRFIELDANPAQRQALQEAFDIINNLRNNSAATSAIHAFFQIRIRIGANIGEVTIGNFGPEGAKQWDVIGLPVINAKRMESTAPIGGLRISEEFFQILEEAGVTDAYFDRFRREAQALGSVYRDIQKTELFAFRQVTLHEKRNAVFRTYSVQVSPNLPEMVSQQVCGLLNHGEAGVQRILEILQYYRGNHYVIDLIEKEFLRLGVILRKTDIISFIQPQIIQEMKEQGFREEEITRVISEQYSLYECFQLMDGFKDIIRHGEFSGKQDDFVSYEEAMEAQREKLVRNYEDRKLLMIQRAYFFEVLYPSVLFSIENCLREYQTIGHDSMEAVEMLEAE